MVDNYLSSDNTGWLSDPTTQTTPSGTLGFSDPMGSFGSLGQSLSGVGEDGEYPMGAPIYGRSTLGNYSMGGLASENLPSKSGGFWNKLGDLFGGENSIGSNVLGGLGTLGSAGLGIAGLLINNKNANREYDLANQNFQFQKDFANTNLANQEKTYNDGLSTLAQQQASYNAPTGASPQQIAQSANDIYNKQALGNGASSLTNQPK